MSFSKQDIVPSWAPTLKASTSRLRVMSPVCRETFRTYVVLMRQAQVVNSLHNLKQDQAEGWGEGTEKERGVTERERELNTV